MPHACLPAPRLPPHVVCRGRFAPLDEQHVTSGARQERHGLEGLEQRRRQPVRVWGRRHTPLSQVPSPPPPSPCPPLGRRRSARGPARPSRAGSRAGTARASPRPRGEGRQGRRLPVPPLRPRHRRRRCRLLLAAGGRRAAAAAASAAPGQPQPERRICAATAGGGGAQDECRSPPPPQQQAGTLPPPIIASGRLPAC